jgi:UDP-N-acetylmuramoyl-tripeptide--D-alanyl-D-alanine ligase
MISQRNPIDRNETYPRLATHFEGRCELMLGELAVAAGGVVTMADMPHIEGASAPVGRVVIDSREVRPGDVFWAMPGKHHDGVQFANDAFARGAAGVVATARVTPWSGRWSMRVDDPLASLWQAAAAVRSRFDHPVIAVTGSVGKTTTRQMIYAVLGSRERGVASPANYNNHLGLPLSILRWRDHHRFAVVELGASGRGEIAALAELAEPDIGVIGPLAEAHLGGFGSRRAIALAKAELLDALPKGGLAVLHGDDRRMRALAAGTKADVVWVGRDADCDVVATDVSYDRGKLRFCVDRFPMFAPVWGRHYLPAALAAYAIGRARGMARDEIAHALARFKAPPHRCRPVQVGQSWVIDDTYNASPTAMRAALELARDFSAPGKRIVVCGDMHELGPEAAVWHRRLGEEIVTVGGADRLISCGMFARHVASAAVLAGMPRRYVRPARHSDEATAILRHWLSPGDVVLVKGSRALGLEAIIAGLRAPAELRLHAA